jgi:undecaprenyl-diphosphatase
MTHINEQLFYFFNQFAGQGIFTDSLIMFVANVVPWILIFVTIYYFLFVRKSVRKTTMLACVVFTTFLTTHFLKWVIFRHPRPFVVLPHVVQLIHISAFDSFPSGHAAVFAALATGVYLYHRRFGIIAIVSALLIGVARIAAGIHYPFDILTGYAIGFIVGIGTFRLIQSLAQKIRRFIS